jgi:hypothetical protein
MPSTPIMANHINPAPYCAVSLGHIMSSPPPRAIPNTMILGPSLYSLPKGIEGRSFTPKEPISPFGTGHLSSPFCETASSAIISPPFTISYVSPNILAFLSEYSARFLSPPFFIEDSCATRISITSFSVRFLGLE